MAFWSDKLTLGNMACCCGCGLFSDSFERADSSSLGSDWTETTGDWEIVSGRARLVTPASGKGALSTTVYEGSPTGLARGLTTTIRAGAGSTAGLRMGDAFGDGAAGVIIPSASADGAEARILAASGTVLAKRTGLTIYPDTAYAIGLYCDQSAIDGSRFTFEIDGVRICGISPGKSRTLVSDGLYVHVASGTIEYDNFAADGLYREVYDENCPVRAETPWPLIETNQVQLTIGAPDLPCFGHDISGTYFLDRDDPPTIAALAGTVVRQYSLAVSIGIVTKLVVTVEENASASPDTGGTLIRLVVFAGATQLCDAYRRLQGFDQSLPLTLVNSFNFPIDITIEPV